MAVENKPQTFRITRNRLILAGIIVAGFVAISALNPEIAQSIISAFGG